MLTYVGICAAVGQGFSAIFLASLAYEEEW
jgi:hypothetical protein